MIKVTTKNKTSKELEVAGILGDVIEKYNISVFTSRVLIEEGVKSSSKSDKSKSK